MGKKAVLAGGRGFLGRALTHRLTALGWDVVVLTRSPAEQAGAHEVYWDGENTRAWTVELEGADALVNLAGRSINCVHTLENSREILASRINAVRALGQAMAKARQPPAVWVQCSAIGYYGNAGDEPCDENSPVGRDFMAEVCRQVEAEFNGLELSVTRQAVLRLGVVLGREAGILPPLVRLVRWYLGGAAGNGRQYLSWIHRDDLLRIFLTALTQGEFSGIYNACAPEPVTNAGLMSGLRTALERLWCPPAPEFVIRLVTRYLLKTEGSLVLHGQRVVPARLLAAGFNFTHRQLSSALADLVIRP